MKKYIFLSVIVVIAALLCYVFQGSKDETSKHVLRVGVECDYAPNNWEEKTPTDFNVWD